VNCFRRPGDFPEPRFWIAERTDGGAEQVPGRRLLNDYFRVAEAPGRRREAGSEGSADRLVRSAHCYATLEIRGLNTPPSDCAGIASGYSATPPTLVTPCDPECRIKLQCPILAFDFVAEPSQFA